MPGRNLVHSETFLTAEEFAMFRKTHDLEVDELSRWLGIDPRDYLCLEKNGGATKMVALALAAIDHGLEAWTPRALKD